MHILDKVKQFSQTESLLDRQYTSKGLYPLLFACYLGLLVFRDFPPKHLRCYSQSF